MNRLDHNRAITQLALKTGNPITSVKQMAIWGNHSPTMYPDIRNTTVNGEAAPGLVDEKWYADEFTPRVQQRGTEIL